MLQLLKRRLLPVLALALVTAWAIPADASNTVLRVSLWGDMAGTMRTDLGFGMTADKGATHGTNAKMGITIFRHSIAAGRVTFEVNNNAEKTIHEMLVIPLKNTGTALPYLKNENRLDETKIHSLGEVSELDPGKSGTLKLTLKPGKYLLVCNVPGHYAGGMWTLLTVRPAPPVMGAL
jgi:uncharacterized cupredoxin-like copper-binding protein